MENIIYTRLSDENFTLNSMDEFLRDEKVLKVWKKIDGEYALVDADYEIVWDLEKRRNIARIIRHAYSDYGFVYGALIDGKVVGYALVSMKPFGSKSQYFELGLFHVSTPYRRRGIGKELFRLASAEAKACGAEKLYISASPTMDTQKAYCRMGCIPATEINLAAVERNPNDIQLEYVL